MARAAMLLAVLTILPASATTLANDGVSHASGILVPGESDSTRELLAPCAAVLRPTSVTVTMDPDVVPLPATTPSPVLHVLVHFAGDTRHAFLDRTTPSMTFTGTAGDGCIADATLIAVAAYPLLGWDVVDHRGPA